MIPTSIFVLRPYKYLFILASCLFACCFLFLMISLLLFFMYDLWEMVLSSGIIFTLMLTLYCIVNKARRIEVVFSTDGFEIHNDHASHLKKRWSDYKGIYLASSFSARQYVLILREEYSKEECCKICNRLDYSLNLSTVIPEGFAVWIPLDEGQKLYSFIPFSKKTGDGLREPF